MIGGRYVFHLKPDAPVETEGGDVTANTVVGVDYTEGDYFGDEHQPTYIIDGNNGGFVVRQEDVVNIVTI